ncbi:ankycorbin-like [Branchiostoma lanceolatum]|uniref:ankycorbin-like n=1 Tax=Branchiostoma lanceolatum TaxID=7740 RepID=UPI00345680A2
MEGRLQSRTPSAGSRTSHNISSELYSVFVRLPNEDVAGFRNLPPGISVYDLKARIEIVAGIPSQIYTLHYTNDVDLEDENELRLGMTIMNGATLRMQLFTSWNGLFYSTWNGNIDDTYYSGGVQLISEANFSEGEAVAMHKIVAKRAFVSLFLACHRGHYVLCKVLLSIGADPVGRTPSGRTPLHAAAAQGHLDVLNALLDQGVDVGVRDMYGKTPLELSGQFGRRECERRLWLHQWNLRAAKTITDADTSSHASGHGSTGQDTNSSSASVSTLGFIHVQGEKPRHIARRVLKPSPLRAHHTGGVNAWSSSHLAPQAPQKSVQLPSMSAPVKGVRYGRIRPGTALLGDKSFPDVCRTSTLPSPRVSSGSEDGKRKSRNSTSRSTSSLYHRHCQTHASYTQVENYDPQDDFNVDDEDIERLIHVVSLSQPSTPVPPDDTDLVTREKRHQQIRKLRSGENSRCSRCRLRYDAKKPISPQRTPSKHFVYPETFSVGSKQLHVMMPEMEYDERPITRCHSVPPPSLCSDDEAVAATIGDDDIPDLAKPPDKNHKSDSINSEDSGRDTMEKTEAVDDDEDANTNKTTEEATRNFVKQREYQIDVNNIPEDSPGMDGPAGSNTKGTQCADEGFSALQTAPDPDTPTGDVHNLQINGVKWDVEKPTVTVAQNGTQTERKEHQENAPKRPVRQRSLSADDKLFLPPRPTSGVLPRAKTLESWILMKTRQKQGRRERPENEERRRRNVEAYQRWLRTKDQEIREDETDKSSESASGDTKENQNAFEQWLKAKRQKAKKERESSAKSSQSSGSKHVDNGTSETRPKIIDGMSHDEWLLQKAEQGAFPITDSRRDTFEDEKTIRKKLFTGGLTYEEWLTRKLQEETLTRRLLEANKVELEKKASEQRKGVVDKNFREWLKHKADENQKEYEKFEAESRKAQGKESERRFRNMKRGVTFRNWREQKEQDRIVEFVAMAQQERQERANDEERKRKSQRSFELWLVRKAQENLNEEKKRLEMERRRFLMAVART